jgi:hypothetical protein
MHVSSGVRVKGQPWRRVALILSSIAVICVPTLFAQGAGASTPASAQSSSPSPWQVQKTANPRLKVEQFSGVSCTSESYCVAVGTRLNADDTQVLLAERWNGSNWQMMRTPSPKGATEPGLTGVSCASTTDCVAVGSNQSTDGFPDPIAESWNGTTWTLDSLPTFALGGQLAGVSCPAVDQCMAVGDRFSFRAGEVGLALSWNGSMWTQMKVAKAPPGTSTALTSVSCNSADECEAVGDSSNEETGTQTSVAEVWNGTSWSLQSTPNPKGSVETTLSGVSCTSASECVAVGDSFSEEFTPATLAEVWNGTSWRITSTPTPSGSEGALLSGVSCSSSDSCTAVGENLDSSGEFVTLAMGWNGTAWDLETSIDPSPLGESFLAVSCGSGSSCVAVGSSGGTRSPSILLVESWNGTSWSTQMAFGKPGQVSANLDQVSCVGTSFCLAVGADSLEDPIAEVSNGSSWKFTSPPAGGGGGGLQDVTCLTTTDCIAVGPSEFFELGLAEQWNGKTWTELSTPEGFGTLDGISCRSATDCMAVGDAESTSGESESIVTLAESWNGQDWTVTKTPNPAGSEAAELLSTSCKGADSCVAVGASENSAGVYTPLVETWNGQKWSIASSAGTNLGSLGLTGVSCPSSADCLAVGYTIDRTGSTDAFSEVWNGSSWTAEKTPTPNGGAEVFGVQCSSASSSSSNCVSVGERARGALVESWNGTAWTIEKAASPPGSDGSAFFNGVDCSSATSCAAVGGYTNSRGLGLTLAEAT